MVNSYSTLLWRCSYKPRSVTNLIVRRTSSSSSNVSATILSSLNTSYNLSLVHYNVQSILPKFEILHAELIDFDILAFKDIWLCPVNNSQDLLLQSYNIPELKNRVGDNHGVLFCTSRKGYIINVAMTKKSGV